MPRKITLFEPHFHDAQFGPTMMSSDGDEDADKSRTASVDRDTGTNEADASGGKSKLKLLAVAAVIAIVGAAAYRRFGGDDSFEIEVEEYEPEETVTSDIDD